MNFFLLGAFHFLIHIYLFIETLLRQLNNLVSSFSHILVWSKTINLIPGLVVQTLVSRTADQGFTS